MAQVDKCDIADTWRRPRRPCIHYISSIVFASEVAEQTKRNRLAEQGRTTSSCSAGIPTAQQRSGRHPKTTHLILAAEPPRLALTRTSTTYNRSSDDIRGQHCCNNSDTTAGSSPMFKHWASELQIYMSLEDHNVTDNLENIKRQTIPIYDDSFIEDELDKQDLSTYKADQKKTSRETTEQELTDDYNAINRVAIQRNKAKKRRRDRGERASIHDEHYLELQNYEETTNTTIADAVKTSMLINQLQGEVRVHLLFET
eukprot:1039786-Amphidinium_carterae.2